MKTFLPWSPSEFQQLVHTLVTQGFEGSKVDFKLMMPVKTSEQKADFLKDVLAFVNTQDDHYRDYGFIIFGVENKEIKGVPEDHPAGESFQTKLENLIREYLSPFVPINVVMFEPTVENGPPWGVIIIPPSNNLPHLVFKEFTVTNGNPNKSLARGQWFVRRGSTTDVAVSEDYAKILRQVVEATITPLADQLKSLQALHNALDERTDRLAIMGRAKVVDNQEEILVNSADHQADIDLPKRFAHRLRGPDDPLLNELLAEVHGLRSWLEMRESEIPWNLGQEQENVYQDIIKLVEDKTDTVLKSIANILIHDKNGRFDEMVINSLSVLATEISIPPGISYTRWSQGLRYYPLLLLSYTIFILGVRFNRENLLRAVLKVSFKRQYRRKSEPLTVGLRYVHDAHGLFNVVLGQNMCDAVKTKAKQYFDQFLIELLPFEDANKLFYVGEFVFSLTSVETSNSPFILVWPGLYLYISDARYHIGEFLYGPPEWFKELYGKPIEDVLSFFDDNAKSGVARACFAEGFSGGALRLFKRESSPSEL
jgi:hypothetical protein